MLTAQLIAAKPPGAALRSFTPSPSARLQRQCACGKPTVAGEECAECQQKRQPVLQHSPSALAINRPGDRYEQEADRVAAAVVSSGMLPGRTLSSAPPEAAITFALGPHRDVPGVRRDATGSGDLSVAPPIVHDVLSSPGQPLDAATRSFMEPRFGHDFSGVRVHTDGRAAASARDVSANAYTVGHNMVFGASRFTPETHEGRRLIAHELTHVVQQLGPEYGVRYIQREPASKAEQGTGDQYLDAVLAFLTAPGLEPDYVSTLSVLNGISVTGILDILSELRQRGLLNRLLDHYADNQNIFVLRIYVAILAVVESGKTTRDDFNRAYGYILEKLPEDQQSVILDKVGAKKTKGSSKRSAAPQKGLLFANNELQEGPAADQGETYAGPSIGPSNEPYDRRRRYIRLPVDDPLQYELMEVWATADEAETMQKQIYEKEASDRAGAALAAGSGMSRGSANPGVPRAPVIPGSIAGKAATYRTGPTPVGKGVASAPLEFPKVPGAVPGSHANDTLPPNVFPLRKAPAVADENRMQQAAGAEVAVAPKASGPSRATASGGQPPPVRYFKAGPKPPSEPMAVRGEALPEGTHRASTTLKPRTASLTDEEMLRANMEAAHKPVPDGHAAHHIVPKRGGELWGDRARKALKPYVGINDADNGVALPGSHVERGTVFEPEGGPYHATAHTEAYYRAVAERLTGVKSEVAARGILRQIDKDIHDGNFPH